MKVRFQADADLRQSIIAGLRRCESTIDFRTAHDAGLAGLNDATVLAIAADEGIGGHVWIFFASPIQVALAPTLASRHPFYRVNSLGS